MLSVAELKQSLATAIHSYDFPCVTFDFRQQSEVRHQSMRDVEAAIQSQLLAGKPDIIKDGFSNVLYWGYARTGYRTARVDRFRDRVTVQQLERAKQTLQHLSGPGVRHIADLKLPEFSGLSFVSKVRMFLNPADYVILDRQLLKLRKQGQRNIFDEVDFREKTSIRVNAHNEAIYERWARMCKRIAITHFSQQGFRAVDVERGIFYRVQNQEATLAAEMLTNL